MARRGRQICLGAAAVERLAAARAVVERILAEERVVYGVTTGFGQLATTHIPVDKVRELQVNLVRSHSVGVGEPLAREVVRAAMAIRVNALAKGYSGVRQSVVELLCDMLDHDLVPWVPSRGSLGASGDLAPSAHLVLAMMGEGELLTPDGRREPALPALRAAGLEPVSLEAKEGLALLNGTQFMAAIGCLAVADGEALLDSADLIGSMSIEGLRASVGPFQERIQLLRPIPGQLRTAENVRRATDGSEIMLSHLNCDKVQDAYSIRCIPQVHGACRDAFRWLREVISIEIESVTDNPLVFPDTGDVISAGNFHGEPLALALDLAAMSFAEIGNMSERRIFRLLTSSLSDLPPFLTTDSGLNNGYMIAQYTAAALVTESKVLCHPASVDSIPTSGDQEDHVSMGMTAALKLVDVARNTQTILGIEALCAAQAIDLLAPLKPGVGTQRGYEVVRGYAPRLGARPVPGARDRGARPGGHRRRVRRPRGWRDSATRLHNRERNTAVSVDDAQRPPRVGQMTYLTEQDKRAIYDAALEIVSSIGMRVHQAEARELLRAAGCCGRGARTWCASRSSSSRRARSTAPSMIHVFDREGELAMELGGFNSYFGTGSDLMSTYDLETGERRPSTLDDVAPRGAPLRRAAQHRLPHVVRAPHRRRPPSRLPRELPRHGRQLDQAAGDDGRERRRPARDVGGRRARCAAAPRSCARSRTSSSTCEPASPLEHPVDSMDKLLFCADWGIPAIYSPAPLAGATAPITVAGHTAQGTAESLFGLVIHQLRRPGLAVPLRHRPRGARHVDRAVARTTPPST